MPTCINKCHLFVLPLPLRVTKNPSATSLYHSLQTFTGKISTVPQQPSSKVAILRSLQKLHCKKYVCIFVIFYYKEMSLKRRTTWRTTPLKNEKSKVLASPFSERWASLKIPNLPEKMRFLKGQIPFWTWKIRKILEPLLKNSRFWAAPL